MIASIARMVKKIATEVTLGPRVPVGVGFPAVVIDGVTKSAANVDPGWVDFDADGAMARVLSGRSTSSTTRTPRASRRCASGPASASAGPCS